MIIKIDGSQLEWRSYLDWSVDPVGIQEIHDKVDVHSSNQEIFKLPDRLISKRFLFRWIYWGQAFAYAADTDFKHVSTSVQFWQDVIDRANAKYYTLYNFQSNMVKTAQSGGIITNPCGREFSFRPYKNKDGSYEYNNSEIVNRPNQGYAHDLMSIARVSMRKRLMKMPEYHKGLILPINTVHDDIEFDVDNIPEIAYNVCILCEDVFVDIPKNFEKVYKKRFHVPMMGEVGFGPNLQNLTKFKRELGVEQFYVN